MIKPRTLVLCTLFLLTLFHTNAQIEKDAIPLTAFLDQINKKFEYHFSYIEEDLKGIQIIPSALVSIENSVTYLRNNTPFEYTILEENTIAINRIEKNIEFCGILVDISGTIISNATIQTSTQSIISNSKGIFTMQTKTPDSILIIKHLGFETKKITINDLKQKPCKKITLFPKIENLNQVILTNYLIKGIDKKLDGSIRIDYNNFGILPGLIEPDLLQTIQALPGILSSNERISDINVRGGTNDQNLILWDGIKMYQSGHFFGLISAFNPYLTKNVQLYKNASSVEYGDGVSSVIAMNTTDTINNLLDTSIGFNLISTDGYIDTPIGQKSSLQIAIRRSINELLKTPTYNQYFDKAFQDTEVINTSNSDPQFLFYDASFRLLYELSSKDLIKLNAITMRNNLVFKENSSINQVAISRESSAIQKNIAGGILYKRKWNAFFESDVLLYGTNYRLKAINSDIENNQRLLQENDVLENGIKVNTLVKNSRSIILKNGYQFNETGITNSQDVNNPTFKDLTKEVIRTHSIFSEIEYTSSLKNNILNAGIRLNYFEKFNKYIVEPRISLIHQFDHFTLEILGEIKSQTTSQVIDLQNDFLGIENRRWVLSNNNNIPIIISKQASIGLSYKHNNWLITSDLYYKKIDGIITKSQGFQNQYESINDHGSFAVAGIDLLINKRFKNISTWLSYSYAKNNYTFNNLSLRKFPNNIDIRNNINFAVTYNIEKFKLSGGLNWHSGKPTTLPKSNTIDNNIQYAQANSSRIKDYIRGDFSATYTFNISKNIKALSGISVWNIFDKKNISNNYYQISNQNTIENIREFGLGLTPNMVFRVQF